MKKTSYSQLEVLNQCPFKWKLVYLEKHFIKQDTIATDFGTLIHSLEEIMFNILKSGKQINYHEIIDLFYNGNENFKGLNKIKELYPNEFITPDKNNRTYQEKAEWYIDSGMCRLEDYLAENPNLKLVEAEKEFNLEYNGYIFHGSIDRIFKDSKTGEYLIEDIKTYSAPLDKEHLTTPLQFAIYTKAFQELHPNATIKCAYELPLCSCKQPAGTKGFVDRGFKKIDKLFKLIEDKDFKPCPSPLCHWCVFSKTFPNQPEEAKNLCPYFCHWTREEKDFSVENEWMGEENHSAILEAFINNYKKDEIILPEIKIEKDNSRRFLIRR